MTSIISLAICIQNSGYEATLKRRKIYETRLDTEAEQSGYLRVVDESGNDYLYPSGLFAEVPRRANEASITEAQSARPAIEDELAAPSQSQIAFAKARLDLYLKNPGDTISWSTIREELG